MGKLISVVVPMYYEEKVVGECYRRLSEVMNNVKYNYELIFVNDGSKDRTLKMLKELAKEDNRIKIIDFARNFGHQIAVTAGIKEAHGDAVIIIDADLQDPPELIVNMIDKWENGYEVVYAKRKKREGETFFKVLTAKYFYKILNVMSDIEIPKDTGDYRLMDRKAVDVFNSMPEKNRFVRGMVSWIGFNQTYVEFVRAERFAGETKYPLKKMLKLAEDGIVSFSNKPIKIIGGIGLLFVTIFFIQIIYAICNTMFGNRVSVIFYLSSYISLIAGIILVAMSVLGTYIGKIFDESNGRPLYIIREKVNFELNK
ncbi:glycosyltransferase family 2 protein [Clostridium gasigenes]|uniref:Dolichol-phosphate mannosyltransferase n=2 Tax=Clostridium gasigenes TaxID=94869 RepID=A0A1H0W1D3_9CLOT|nr:glycosyltransferase family 2 protein [Clostridium gasigenes]MBB6625609.1 glycosyltransferase family 2 protein [Clostridium gasigenes]MBU3106173.1 glycosyltransferase family 2 protein [Clostridium gasigenes]MBU3134555.1 glycosyltransferase family 2 protein [Clostridium gasigenes]NKF08798.1 glycosyltransferase family 2 protein [Clostridium gasigenes]QSW20870.1 glycosyltransferase family 2 protein [Clostridium gasigenes]